MTRKYNHDGRPGCVSSRVLDTGVETGVFNAKQARLNTADGDWAAICLTHGSVTGCPSQSMAKALSINPMAWCDECSDDKSASELEQLMSKAGFTLDNTGGGAWIWRRKLGKHKTAPEISLTDVEDTSYQPPGLDEPVAVSMWIETKTPTLVQWVSPTLRSFLESFYVSNP